MAAARLQSPDTAALRIALQRLRPSTISSYASILRTLARHAPTNNKDFADSLEAAFASMSSTSSPNRSWSIMAALQLALQLRLIPPFDLGLCKAMARGANAKQSTVDRQLWFHPDDLHIVDKMDSDFSAAAHCSFDLMLRAGQIEQLLCGDIDLETQSVWCPPHKATPFPYLRKPHPGTLQRLVAIAHGRPPSERLFQRSGRQYSEMLGALTEQELGTRYTWHSLRRGGATTRAHLGHSSEDIRRFGAWTSERALTHYIFPWSSGPLRKYRNETAIATAEPSTSVPAEKQNKNQRSLAKPPTANRARHSGNVRLPARQVTRTPPPPNNVARDERQRRVNSRG